MSNLSKFITPNNLGLIDMLQLLNIRPFSTQTPNYPYIAVSKSTLNGVDAVLVICGLTESHAPSYVCLTNEEYLQLLADFLKTFNGKMSDEF